MLQFVSIPFERESVFRRRPKSWYPKRHRFNSLRAGKCVQTLGSLLTPKKLMKFQFPSSGKVCSDDIINAIQLVDGEDVSIPFERESVFRLCGLT